MTICLLCDMVVDEELLLFLSVNTVCNGSDRVFWGARKAVTERDITIGCDTQQAQPSTASVCLTYTFVNFFDRVGHICEAVMFVTKLQSLRFSV